MRSLPVGDFAFQPMDDIGIQGKEKRKQSVRILPVIIERKEAIDVAASLMDNRWHSQQRKMRDFKEKHFDLSHNVDCTSSSSSSSSSSSISSTCKLVYVIEGNLASVKRCGGPTHLEAEEAVSNLELSGYTVLRTTGMAQTINAVVSELKRLEALSLSSQQGQQSRKAAESKSRRIDYIDANRRAPDTNLQRNDVHLQVPVVVTSPPLIGAESENDTLLSSWSIDYRQTSHVQFSDDTRKKERRDGPGNQLSKCSLKRQRTASGSQYDAIQVDDSSEDENSDVIFVCERPGVIDCSPKQSDEDYSP